MVFILPFQIIIYHLILTNNCSNVFPPVLTSWSCSRGEATIHCIGYTRYNQSKLINFRIIKWRYMRNSKTYWSYPWFEHCFDFPVLLMLTFDVFWGSLGTNFFWKSSSGIINTQMRQPSSLSFYFLWIWLKTQVKELKIKKVCRQSLVCYIFPRI